MYEVVRPPDEVHIEVGMLCFGMTISLLVLIKEVIIKTISQQEQIGRSQFKRVVSA
jgi:predicted transcriptional regulator YheO